MNQSCFCSIRKIISCNNNNNIIIIIIIVIAICCGNLHKVVLRLLFPGGEKLEKPEKNPWNKDENQQQTQPTYGAGSVIEPRLHWWEAMAITSPTPSPLKISPSVHKLRIKGCFSMTTANSSSKNSG